MVGTYSCRGIDDAKPKTNQDYACIAHPFAKRRDCALFCVMDGHGKQGDIVAQECLNSIYSELEEHEGAAVHADPPTALISAFEKVRRNLKTTSPSPTPPHHCHDHLRHAPLLGR